MKVLIAGATGFTGSHLMDFLLTKDNTSIFGVKSRSVLCPHKPESPSGNIYHKRNWYVKHPRGSKKSRDQYLGYK